MGNRSRQSLRQKKLGGSRFDSLVNQICNRWGGGGGGEWGGYTPTKGEPFCRGCEDEGLTLTSDQSIR